MTATTTPARTAAARRARGRQLQAMRHHLAQYRTEPIPAEATRLVPLQLARFAGLQPMIGESTDVPGLLIAPQVAGQPGRFSGKWCVVHQPSGMRLSPPAAFIYAREAVSWLQGAGIDWTRAVDDVGTDPAAAEVFAQLHHATGRAEDEHRPLHYARTSWVDWPPLWRVCRGGRVSEPGFFTYDGAAEFADAACAHPPRGGGLVAELLHPDAVIHRDTHSPGWALRCASQACEGREMWFVDEWDEGAPITMLDTRANVATYAAVDGWRVHDLQHWTCPACTRLYQ